MKFRGKARRTAVSAMFGALALVLLYVGVVSPAGNMGIIAVAGLMPAAVVISAGLAAGFLCWGGVTILAFLLIPDKLAALLFGALFGLYPMVKCAVERLRKLPLEYVLKLLFFNLSFTVIYLIMKESVLAWLPTRLHTIWLLYAAGNAVFLLYDYGFSKLISLYTARIHRYSR